MSFLLRIDEKFSSFDGYVFVKFVAYCSQNTCFGRDELRPYIHHILSINQFVNLLINCYISTLKNCQLLVVNLTDH